MKVGTGCGQHMPFDSKTTLADLAVLIGVPYSLLITRAFSANRHLLYSTITLRKRNGSARIIHAPNWPLAFMQRQIAALLSDLYRPSSRAHGFVKGRSIRTNASAHLGKRLILNIDIEDFFPTITFARIRGRLMSAPYSLSNQVATAIARLCTLDDVLPIGAPSSPVISNIICSKMDFDLANFARESGCFYTRYADDITFSSNRARLPLVMVKIASDQRSGKAQAGDALDDFIRKNGFSIKHEKTRLLNKNDSQEICGITCNEKLNTSRRIRRDIRAMTHAWRKFGYNAAEGVWKQKYNWRNARSFERSLRGKIEHLVHIRGEDDAVVKSAVDQFNALPSRKSKSIHYPYRGGWKENLLKTVCVVDARNDDLVEYRQGSGFLVKNGFVVTNAHNVFIHGAVAPEIFIRFPGHLDLDIEVELIVADTQRDIAVLCPKDAAWKDAISTSFFEVIFRKPSRDEAIWLTGFPSYWDGDPVRCEIGHTIGPMTEAGLEYFRINVAIVKGHSGGPVLDVNGRVIGIATKGIDTDEIANIHRNASIPLSDVASLLAPLIAT